MSRKTVYNKPSKEELYEYYVSQNHSVAECADHFKYGKTTIINLLSSYNIKKGMKLRQVLIERTNIKKYHTKNPMQNKQVKEKSKNTCLKRYGTQYVFQNKDVQEKIKQSNLKKYGVDNPFKSSVFQEKGRNTMIKKYGVPNCTQNKLIKDKVKNTNLKRYGFTSALLNKDVQQKTLDTNIKKYACAHHTQRHITEDLKKVWLDNNQFYQYIKDHYNFETITISSIAKDFNVKPSTLHDKLVSVGLLDEIVNKYRSSFEKDLYLFLSTLTDETILHNDRTIIGMQELDLYCPALNIAVEFNGNYWHCSLHKDYDYHQNKSLMFLKKGIFIFQIFEYDWKNNSDLIRQQLTLLFKEQSKIRDNGQKIILDLNYNNPLPYLNNGYTIKEVISPTYVLWDNKTNKLTKKQGDMVYKIYNAGKLVLEK